MSNNSVSGIQYLDQCLSDLDSLKLTRKLLEKFEKICTATQQSQNLADIIQDPVNRASVLEVLGQGDFEPALQLLVRLSMTGYSTRSFTVNAPIEGEKKMDFLARSVSAWSQFNTVLFFQFPDVPAPESLLFVNPRKNTHWRSLQSIPAGTLINVFIKDLKGDRSLTQEKLACERYEAIFDLLQNQHDLDATPSPVLQIGPETKPGNGNGNGTVKRSPRPAVNPSRGAGFNKFAAASGKPSFAFQVRISKTDVFVHAGNAQLIITHLRGYQGVVMFYVLRDKKQKVQLDADSIWGAEIRNGETVLFEFFGPKPSETFVKELAKKVNKYTQMDKLGND